MFTGAEAVTFAGDTLGVTDVEARLETDRRSLLEDIVVAMQTELTFSNLRLLSVPKADRKRPTLEEIKSDLVSGVGGLCYNLNVGAFYLLQALGYKVAMSHASCTSSVQFENNHVVVVVSDLVKPGDKFLVEVGYGFATFRIISLDFEKETDEFRDSFLEYKLIRHEGKVLRMHRKGCPVAASGRNNPPLDLYVDGWRRFYWVEPETVTSLEDFSGYFDQVFENPAASPFHGSLRIVGFPGRKAAVVVNQRIMLENEKGDLQPIEVEGGDEGFLAKVKELFPAFPEQLIRDAFNNYKQAN